MVLQALLTFVHQQAAKIEQHSKTIEEQSEKIISMEEAHQKQFQVHMN